MLRGEGKYYDRDLVDGTLLEIVWTIIPAVVLVFIASAFFKVMMDKVVGPALTIKIIGHQWYWSYEYSDYQEETLEFDSYMVPTSDLNSGDFRLLEVDHRLVVPIKTHVRILVTGADVLYSFAVPALGLKTNAVPGRLNQAGVFIKRLVRSMVNVPKSVGRTLSLNRGHFIIMIISIELILLAAFFWFLINPIEIDLLVEQVFTIMGLTIAAAESVIGLAITVAYYRIRGTIAWPSHGLDPILLTVINKLSFMAILLVRCLFNLVSLKGLFWDLCCLPCFLLPSKTSFQHMG